MPSIIRFVRSSRVVTSLILLFRKTSNLMPLQNTFVFCPIQIILSNTKSSYSTEKYKKIIAVIKLYETDTGVPTFT